MTDEAEARDTWMATEAFKRLSDPTTLGTPNDQRRYLRNRLDTAFIEGMTAGQKVAEQRLLRAIHREIFK